MLYVTNGEENNMRVPCTFQGGKQRVVAQIVDVLLESCDSETQFYDLCCGSGAISIELVNRGVATSQINMFDISSWGLFWSSIGSGAFKLDIFESLLSEFPSDKRGYKDHVFNLSKAPVGDHEAEIYIILQSCSFGGKQIWRNGDYWMNTCFRDYWEPTETSIRRSPVNPMQPSVDELSHRVHSLVDGMGGVTCFNTDIMTMIEITIPLNSIIYLDPPYQNTTGYPFKVDTISFINNFKQIHKAPLFVSEGIPLNDNALNLTFGGPKGGISGVRKEKHQEWLSRF